MITAHVWKKITFLLLSQRDQRFSKNGIDVLQNLYTQNCCTSKIQAQKPQKEHNNTAECKTISISKVQYDVKSVQANEVKVKIFNNTF